MGYTHTEWTEDKQENKISNIDVEVLHKVASTIMVKRVRACITQQVSRFEHKNSGVWVQ